MSLKKLISLSLSLSLIFSVMVFAPVSTQAFTGDVYNDLPKATHITFTERGFSDSNGTEGTNYQIVTDPSNPDNTCLKLTTTSSAGYNVEVAESEDSTNPFIMTGNTTYKISFKYKAPAGSSGSTHLLIYIGTKSGYAGDAPKKQIYNIALPSTTTDSEWLNTSFTFTTKPNMLYNEYSPSEPYTNVCDRFYIVVGQSAGSVYVDDFTIAPYGHSTNYDFTYGGWSDTNGSSTQFAQVADPDNSENLCIKLSGSGYNFELAANNLDTETPFVMVPKTKYTVVFKYKSVTTGGTLNLYFGTQSAASGSLSKYMKYTKNLTEESTTWQTASVTFTTTDTMAYNEYVTSGTNTNICDKFYFVHGGSGDVYVDDVTVVNYSEFAVPDEQANAKTEYEIKSFNHFPYSDIKRGSSIGSWYTSLRYFSDTVDSNSVLGYHFLLDIDSNLIGASNSGSGKHGEAIGTNGTAMSSAVIVAEDGTPIEVNRNKAYRISFKYKVLTVGEGSYIGFSLSRSLYQAGYCESYAVETSGYYTYAMEFSPTSEWKTATYTFLADYTSKTDYKYLKLAMNGYGEALIDDIKVEIIKPSEVEERPDFSNYKYTTSSGKATISQYSGSEATVKIPNVINGSITTVVDDFTFLYNSTAQSIIIPDSITTIGSYAFEHATALTSITIPQNVTYIGNAPFSGATALTEIIVADGNENYVSLNGVLYTADMKTLISYPAGNTATSFTVPSSVTKIADCAFHSATNLVSISLPDGLLEIGASAFMNCTALTSISIPSGITELKASTFRGCTALATIDASDSLVYGEHSFFGCDLLYKVGNIDNDSATDIKDALKLVQYLAECENSNLNKFEMLSADVNNDGEVDLLDSAILQRHLAGWKGYEDVPCTGRSDIVATEFNSSSDNAELIVNLGNMTSNQITTNRDIEYDKNKEDVIIILVIGQSNSTSGVGYGLEYKKYYVDGNPGQPTEETTRPLENTVFSGKVVTELTSSNDVYNLANPEKGTGCMGGYTPALGKVLHEKTGAKIVFLQAAAGATGMHEWVKNPKDYTCTCPNNGKFNLYANAINNFTRTYQSLKEDYNIISTAYIYNQGEHEEFYKTGTVHDAQSYYDAYVSMHNSLLSDCELDFGGIFMPRSFYKYNKYYTNDKIVTMDVPQYSRCTTTARMAMYRAANDIDNLFVVSTWAENIDHSTACPVNDIHYSQIAYNNIGTEAGNSIAGFLGINDVSTFTGITLYNSQGVILAKFDKDGTLLEGSNTVAYTDNGDNNTIRIAIEPLGTYYTYDFTETKLANFVDNFGQIDWTALQNAGYSTFDVIINSPVK